MLSKLEAVIGNANLNRNVTEFLNIAYFWITKKVLSNIASLISEEKLLHSQR